MKFSEIEEEYCKQVLTILKKFEYEPNNAKTRKNIETMVADHFYDFMESHTGLEDVMIEKEILAHCFRQHKAMRKKLYA